MNRDLLAVRPHASRTISDAVRDRCDVVDLTVGVSDFGPPDLVRRAMAAAVASPSALDRYEHAQGHPALREAIAERCRRRYGTDQRAADVLVTQGAAEALWLSVFAFTSPGDGVLLPDPGYMLYGAVVDALGRRALRVPTTHTDGFRMTPRAVIAALAAPATMLILNSPANPTGATYSADQVAELIHVAAAHDLVVVHDEVFDDFCWAQDHVPAALVAPPHADVVMVNSMSKRYGMTGWRVGWMTGPPDLIAAASKAHTFLTLASPSHVQAALSQAVTDPAVAAEVASHRTSVRERMERTAAALVALPGVDLGASRPGGGFYLFPRVAGIEVPAGDHPTHGEAVADHLLRTCGVAVVPGIVFGPSGGDHVRVSVAGAESALDTALARLADALG